MIYQLRSWAIASAAMLALSGCLATSSCGDDHGVRLSRTPTEHMINNGIKSYEDGNYVVSMATLQALVENKTASTGEKVLAHKYMAFMHCVSSTESREARDRTCRESFKRAIELDPNFELSAAEAGHPLWGPVFKSVKHPVVK